MDENQMYEWIGTRALLKVSQYTHISIVRAFMTWHSGHAESRGEPTPDEVIQWVRLDREKRTVKNVAHRANVIYWFLRWRSQRGLGENPVDVLTERHGISRKKLWPVLMRDDYQEVLQKLKPRMLWASALGPIMKTRLERRRGLGFDCRTEEVYLLKFDLYLQEHPSLAQLPLREIAHKFSAAQKRPRARYYAMLAGRWVSLELRRANPEAAVIEIDRTISRDAFVGDRKPYIFTEAEIARLFRSAMHLPAPKEKLRPLLLRTMLTLLYCTGLRVGEAQRLRFKDIDFENSQLEILKTKFNKSRLVPFSRSVGDALKRYIAATTAAGAPADPEAPVWWSLLRRTRYSGHFMSQLMRKVFVDAGVKPGPGNTGPRIHDLRHTFVAHRMMQWYRDGADVQSRLPFLATYLGHRDISSTLVYITLTTELMQSASERFRKSVSSLKREDVA